VKGRKSPPRNPFDLPRRSMAVAEASTADPEHEKKLLRRFFIVWTAQAFSLVGSGVVQFALVWWLTIDTGSATVLALAMMAAMLPQVVGGPFVGPLVDRWNRRHVMVAADTGIAVVTLVLILLFIAGAVEVWHVFVAMALRGVGGAFHWPAMAASTSLMVPKRHMTRVGGLNQAVNGVVGIVAPALAAAMIVFLPMEWVLSVDIVTAAIAVAPLLFIMIPQPTADDSGPAKSPSVLREMREGFTFLKAWPGMVAFLLLIIPINMVFAPAGALMPIFVTEYFHEGVEELAMIEISFGASFIIGGVVLGIWGGTKRKMYTILGGGVVSGLAGVGVGLVPPDLFVLALFWFFVTGFSVAVLNGCAMGVMQNAIRADMQGRVFALVGSVTMAMSPIGLLIAGPVADAVGVSLWFVMAGVVTTGLMLLGFMMPSVVKLEDRIVEQTTVEEK